MSEKFIDKLIILQGKDYSLMVNEQEEKEDIHLLMEKSLELALWGVAA